MPTLHSIVPGRGGTVPKGRFPGSLSGGRSRQPAPGTFSDRSRVARRILVLTRWPIPVQLLLLAPNLVRVVQEKTGSVRCSHNVLPVFALFLGPVGLLGRETF